MTDIKRVKISHLIESQIPEFLNQESPLFKSFLTQYYESQEHQSGMTDLASNLAEYRKIGAFNDETLIASTTLTGSVFAGDTVITVSSTDGWPDTYGLLKIDNEIITYTGKTTNRFFGCARGFSGIDQISKEDAAEFANFAQTQSEVHTVGATVINLSNLFLQEFFTKFKTEFLPGFENRSFTTGTSITNVLTRAKDFYMAKGTDASYQILFKLLYGQEIELIKPIDRTLIPSDNVYFKTKHVLVENLFGGQPLETIGNFLYQNIAGIGTASASIYNVEYRPINQTDFYEISLDSTSFDGSFEVPGKTKAAIKNQIILLPKSRPLDHPFPTYYNVFVYSLILHHLVSFPSSTLRRASMSASRLESSGNFAIRFCSSVMSLILYLFAAQV